MPCEIIPYGIMPNGIKAGANPFSFGGELEPAGLVDRDEEVQAVVNAMERGGKLFLIGPRRYGKTSILRAAADRVKKRKGIVLRYDAEAFTSLELLASRLLVDTASNLTGTVERVGTLIRDFFKSVRPTATFNATENKWSVTLAGHETAGGVPLLTDVLNGIERAATKKRRTVAVVIDEFQKIIALGGEAAEAQIRAAIQRHRRVAYVFAGSDTRLLADMTSDPRRPFYKLGERRFVGPVPRAEFAAFIKHGFSVAAIPVDDDAVDAILDDAEEVPYNVQLLAHECWDQCRETRKPTRLTAGLVRDAKAIAALRNDPLYSQLWNSLSATQQTALLALLRVPRSEGLTSAAVSRKYGIPVPSMQKALVALESKGVIREEHARAGSLLRLEDPFFGAWVELVVPR